MFCKHLVIKKKKISLVIKHSYQNVRNSIFKQWKTIKQYYMPKNTIIYEYIEYVYLRIFSKTVRL